MMLFQVMMAAVAVLAVLAVDQTVMEDLKLEAFDAFAEPDEMVENGPFFIDDMEIFTLRSGVLRSQAWPNGIIYYTLRGFTSSQEDGIREAMREIEKDVNGNGGTCIKFQPRSGQTNYIDINYGSGCHSVIGMVNRGAQDVSLGSGCQTKGIIMHELIHTIGFWHEQNRPDRGTYVNINLNNVQDGHTHNFKLLSSSSVSYYGQSYDFDSIMHYNAYTWAIDKTKPVMTPKPGKGATAQMGQRIRLSSGDVKKIQTMYRCTVDASHIVDPLRTANRVAECNFATGWCGMSRVSGLSYSWIRTSSASTNGPLHGHSTGVDNYAVVRPGHGSGVARMNTPTSNDGDVCVDMYLFQKGPTSYLKIYAEGSRISKQLMKSYSGYYSNQWSHKRLNLNIPSGYDFHLIFEATIGSESVAIDDLHIYNGDCQ